MTKDYVASWFDKKNYEVLKSMSLEDWQKLLGERYEFYMLVKSCRESFYQSFYEQGCYFQFDFLDSLVPPEELMIKILSLLKKGVITNFGLRPFPVQRTLNNPMASGRSVNNLTVQDMVNMSKDSRLHNNIDIPNDETLKEKHKPLKEKLDKIFEGTNYDYELEFASHEELLQDKKNHWQEMLSKPFEDGHKGNAKIIIDLCATDAKLRKDFDQWLKDIRESTGYNDNVPKNISKEMLSNKELYTQHDFDHWIKFGVIPYLDLTLAAEIEYKEISQKELALKIFPNEPNSELDTLVRTIQVTMPLAERLIKNKMHKTLLAQLDYQIPPT